eukprot:CAMPEP_0179031836 /NCGR_PEP_ID=MMETSP0796-20121207/11273_1 /TAXON_ID=73915 /ORGANISM="Pyrodinium bahamense, Strain pbaha01" /LENGTH=661 /DNA_ID=CAMNT_0020728035 /DNA_START=109 /DNA_END=2094 /DNA_ORIENTATION=+
MASGAFVPASSTHGCFQVGLHLETRSTLELGSELGELPTQPHPSKRHWRVSAIAALCGLCAAISGSSKGQAAAGVGARHGPPSRSCSSSGSRGYPLVYLSWAVDHAAWTRHPLLRQCAQKAAHGWQYGCDGTEINSNLINRPCASLGEPARFIGADSNYWSKRHAAGVPRRMRQRLWAAVGVRIWRHSVARMSSTASDLEPLAGDGGPCPSPVLYNQRWVQLAFLAALALLSDLVCFSVAATPETWTAVFDQDPANLIDLFLFTNVFACFLEPVLVRRFGLRRPIIAAAMLMAVGCALRSGLPFVGDQLPGYAVVVAGTMLVAVAQPFFQCTPPLLSATWFAPNERALATAVAINFNQVGIATAFLVGGELGRTEVGLKEYFGLITVASVLVAAGAFLGFQDRPPTPPSFSALEKAEAVESNSEEPSFLEQAFELFRTPGFAPPLAAFVTSIAVTNVVGAFMEQKLVRAGISDQGTIDFSGAGFELAIVLGGILLGGVVDRNKEYKAVTLGCLAATLVGVLLFGIGKLPGAIIIAALLAVGAFAGPVQPINAELAVEVTYPADENAIEAVQQLCGNLASALLVPLCEWAAHWDVPWPPSQVLPSVDTVTSTSSSGAGSLQGDTVLLLLIVFIVGVYFSTFSAPLRRTLVDSENCLTPPEVS